MTQLNRLSIQRLKRLPRIASVWEGDRRRVSHLISAQLDEASPAEGGENDCIIWVDGTQGAVRSLNIVPADSGYEPIVRTLLQAIENPQGAVNPARPQKIVVSDREIQFYLRGALQDLDIAIDYEPELPLIDELFEALYQAADLPDPQLPEQYEDALLERALDIWEVGPWQVLNEQQVLSIDINAWDVERLYISVLGMAGVEYGLLMYRSLESLKQFRERILTSQGSAKQMQEAFLEQDCLFLNYELIEASPFSNLAPVGLSLTRMPEAIEPEFGSLHPLEGLRTALEAEECATLLVAMEAIKRFFTKYRRQIEQPPFKTLQGKYRIPNPEKPFNSDGPASLSVTVSTLPELAAELMEQTEAAILSQERALSEGTPALRDDYIPEGSLVLLTQFPKEWLTCLQQDPAVHYQSYNGTANQDADTLPTVLIQTSRPKAKTLIQHLEQAQGIQGVCFNPGTDPFSGIEFHLGLLQTGNGELHLFAEYDVGDATDRNLLTTWQHSCSGTCSIVIAGGVTGAARGKPRLKDVIGVFEAAVRSPQDLKLPPLMLQYVADWDLD